MLNLFCHSLPLHHSSLLRHSGEGRNLIALLKKIPAFAGMTLLLSFPAYAEDVKPAEEIQVEKAVEAPAPIKEEEKAPEKTSEKPAGYYSPDFCDFEVTFPEAPAISKRCPPDTGKCFTLTSYTFVYDMKTSIEVSVSCSPSTPANYERYSDAVVKAALKGMVARAGIKEFEINTQEDKKVRQGSLLGTGTYGKQNRLYNAQLWVGQNSILSVEAKLTGHENPEADEDFGDILASIKVKDKAP